MKKVEVKFPSGFSDTADTPSYIQLGRLIIGDGICRLFFAEDGKVHMHCERRAKDFITIAPEQTDLVLYGLEKGK